MTYSLKANTTLRNRLGMGQGGSYMLGSKSLARGTASMKLEYKRKNG